MDGGLRVSSANLDLNRPNALSYNKKLVSVVLKKDAGSDDFIEDSHE